MKYIVLNILLALAGIIVCCIGIAYIWWLSRYIGNLNPAETFINVILVSISYIVPSLILLGGGFALFLKALMDPIE